MKIIKIGDVVIPKNSIKHRLYHVLKKELKDETHAICVSTNPFVLVTEDGMIFTKLKRDNFMPLCQAAEKLVLSCIRKYNSTKP